MPPPHRRRVGFNIPVPGKQWPSPTYGPQATGSCPRPSSSGDSMISLPGLTVSHGVSPPPGPVRGMQAGQGGDCSGQAGVQSEGGLARGERSSRKERGERGEGEGRGEVSGPETAASPGPLRMYAVFNY